MKIKKIHFIVALTLLTLQACGQNSGSQQKFPIQYSEKQWEQKLTPEQFYILRKHGTETPFTGSLLDNKKEGTYVCAACNHPLFSSKTKFNSGTGWPSFYDFITGGILMGYGNQSNEVHCANCGGHLGYVFQDGPKPTGLRYCINSVALKFVEK